MRQYTFTDKKGAEHIRITKTEARRQYSNGKTITLIPCDFRPFGFWVTRYSFSKKERERLTGQPATPADFDKIVIDFEYYNCINSETGRRAAYYIAVADR